ncbi:DUF6338 family protein [Streptomyces chartreusis]|uniref:DUF6338 family protein n=1 Tax=Streptomyces chartreusis TaxID=1969 RepID=UPI002E809FC0|nr:DUF6338 family protein [Streptomyces chartreusis]WUB23860.1 DUF6338 family protein [Streptomyces chartreusis]
MPATFTSLLLFIVLLAPGFAYAAVRDRHRPERTSTALRETSRVVLASVGFGAAALVLFACVRVSAPGLTPDVGRLVRERGAYVRMHYAETVMWTAAVLLLAVLFAVLAARFLPRRPFAVNPESSAWWVLFDMNARANGAQWIQVGCELTDGSYLAGRVHHYSPSPEETGDRELALGPPFEYRPAPGGEQRDLSNTHRVVVSARQIKFLGVTYFSRSGGTGGSNGVGGTAAGGLGAAPGQRRVGRTP